MTTDFLITCNSTINRYDRAHTIKSKIELLEPRVLEKFEIERVYWERADIDWGIVTEEEINKTMALNISFVHGYHDIYKIDGFEFMSPLYLEDLTIEYISRMLQENESIRTISQQFDHDFDLMMGSGLSIFKHLVINKVIEVDLLEKLNISSIIPIKAIREDFSEKVNAI